MTRLRSAVLFLSLFVLMTSKNFAAGPLQPEHIHWSTESTLRSPDGRWTLYVKPSDADDDDADVYVSHAGNETRLQLLKLQRDAEVYWRPGQDQAVIVDEKSSNEYRLLVFDLKKPSERTALKLNREIARDVRERLQSGDQVTYYFPHVSRWVGKADALITVGTVTVHNGTGPFTAHCTGYISSLESQEIRSRLDEQALREKYGASCQIWP